MDGVHWKIDLEVKMQFKHKLIYFALGCAFVVIGQVLLSVLVPKVTAQGKKESAEFSLSELLQQLEAEAQSKKASAEFDTVKVRSLQIVDNAGKVRAKLEVTKRDSIIPVDDVIQVFNNAGVSVYRVGVANVMATGGNVAVYSNDGKITAQISGRASGGDVAVYSNDGKGIASISVALNGSGTVLCSKEEKRAAMTAMSKDGVEGGLVWVSDKNGQMRASMCVDANSGRTDFYDNDGKTCVAIGVDEYGNGAVNAWDKNGHKLR